MAQNDPDKKEYGDSLPSSAHPKDWPGIPGRSSEHEVEPAGRKASDQADVTEAQRDLERETEVEPDRGRS
jgi:hypothetical protein